MNRFSQLYRIIIIAAVLSVNASAGEISYQGRLTDSDGNPISDTAHEISFILYDDSVGGDFLWGELVSLTPIDGFINHLIGSTQKLENHLFSEYERLYLEIRIDNQPLSPRRLLGTVPYAITANSLKGVDSTGAVSIVADSDKRKFTIYNDQGEPAITLQPGWKDTTVILPDYAINSDEMFNEPGISVEIETDLITLLPNEMIDLVEVPILTPSDGYIVLYAKCYLLLSGTVGANSAIIQIDENEGGGTQFPYYTIAGLSGYQNTGTNYFPVFVTRIYYKKRGIYSFRLEGRASNPTPAVAQSWDHVLTATFFPTSYYHVSSVEPTSMGDPNAEIIINQDSTHQRPTGTFYKVDLERIRLINESDSTAKEEK